MKKNEGAISDNLACKIIGLHLLEVPVAIPNRFSPFCTLDNLVRRTYYTDQELSDLELDLHALDIPLEVPPPLSPPLRNHQGIKKKNMYYICFSCYYI